MKNKFGGAKMYGSVDNFTNEAVNNAGSADYNGAAPAVYNAPYNAANSSNAANASSPINNNYGGYKLLKRTVHYDNPQFGIGDSVYYYPGTFDTKHDDLNMFEAGTVVGESGAYVYFRPASLNRNFGTASATQPGIELGKTERGGRRKHRTRNNRSRHRSKRTRRNR